MPIPAEPTAAVDKHPLVIALSQQLQRDPRTQEWRLTGNLDALRSSVLKIQAPAELERFAVDMLTLAHFLEFAEHSAKAALVLLHFLKKLVPIFNEVLDVRSIVDSKSLTQQISAVQRRLRPRVQEPTSRAINLPTAFTGVGLRGRPRK